MSAPDSVHELAKARLAARAERNFALSDQLRDEIAALGFEVVDIAGGYELRPKKRFPTYESTRDIRPINSGKFEITVAMIIDGFHEDAVTTIKTIKEHSQCAIAILVVGDPGKPTHCSLQIADKLGTLLLPAYPGLIFTILYIYCEYIGKDCAANCWQHKTPRTSMTI